MTVARVTQSAEEVLRTGTPTTRVTQAATEVLRVGTATTRITQAALEVLRKNQPDTGGVRPVLVCPAGG